MWALAYIIRCNYVWGGSCPPTRWGLEVNYLAHTVISINSLSGSRVTVGVSGKIAVKLVLILVHQYNSFLDSNWVQTHRHADQAWLADSLNWEKMPNLSTLDSPFLTFLYNSSFVNRHLTTNYSLRISRSDTILIMASSSNYSVSTLYVSYLNDLYRSSPVSYLLLISLFFPLIRMFIALQC